MSEEKAYGIIYETRQYDMFKHLEGNREVKRTNVNKIISSIKVNGYIENPIIVNDHLEIIDGQHRLEALKELNMPVHYIIVKNKGLKECSVMNAKATVWSTKDFLNANVARGSKNAEYILKLCDKYNVTEQIAITSIYGLDGNAKSKAISDGYITDHMKCIGERTLEFITSGTYDKAKGTYRTFTKAIRFLITDTECDMDVLKNKLIKYSQDVMPYNNIENCLRSIEKIYNYRIRNNYINIISIYEMSKRKSTKK